jgi:tetratricopeptide (TPR) repeat protein
MRRAPHALTIALALSSALGCNRAEPSESERCMAQDAGAPIDPLLLAFLSRARAAHHLADDHENAGDLGAAIAPLAALVGGPLPAPAASTPAPEVREVLADTHARLADLRSRLGAFDQALADIQAGLDNARDPNYFRGHLLETEGLVEERRAKSLETSNPSEAAAARKLAIDRLEQAMAVQSSVLSKVPPPPVNGRNPTASADGGLKSP